MKYVIGVDIGATKSHLALFDTEGTLVDFGHWGPLNHEALPGSFAQFKDELEQFTAQILSKNGLKLEQIVSAAFGIAGVDTKLQHSIISKIIKEIGFTNFRLANDAFIGIFAGSPAGTGICAINGTGSTLAGINKEGKMLQIGGVGYVSADYGGGSLFREKVVSIVYSELFRKGETTCMTPVLLEKLCISDKFDFVDKVYEKIEDDSLNIPLCAKILFEAALKNDKAASDVIYGVATSYANGISCMIEELEFNQNEDINIVFAGSVFVKSEYPLLLDTIKEKLNRENPGYSLKYTLLDMPPVAGAVFWAFNNLNISDKNVFYYKICNQFREKSSINNK